MDLTLLRALDQVRLLRLARLSIEAAMERRPLPELTADEITPGLQLLRAAFVALKKDGELRGCIGRMDHNAPLWRNVRYAAVAAALEDPRFPPLKSSELTKIVLEISVLEPPVDLPSVDQFNPQRQGIIVENGFRHALLLPKVAQEYGWDAEKTLAAVCSKAGLEADAWRNPATRLQVFEALAFSER